MKQCSWLMASFLSCQPNISVAQWATNDHQDHMEDLAGSGPVVDMTVMAN